jgi:hypothetical protein
MFFLQDSFSKEGNVNVSLTRCVPSGLLHGFRCKSQKKIFWYFKVGILFGLITKLCLLYSQHWTFPGRTSRNPKLTLFQNLERLKWDATERLPHGTHFTQTRVGKLSHTGQVQPSSLCMKQASLADSLAPCSAVGAKLSSWHLAYVKAKTILA